ncbi:MAG: nuclear transport factor 2 family protein [Kaiparowitsia implicata GSE-PSE-MK54-09C]|nr:nuclear transport factor 2 family protein [Kaiparowitsia implicata GSE-PSE-MK54-09C]
MSANGSVSVIESLTFDSTPKEQTLSRYFATLNAGDFQATAALFAPDGMLNPPFEAALTGPEAIALYLSQEANGLQLQPLKKTSELLEDGSDRCKYDVLGSVQTSLFTVNVCWLFVLNSQAEICSVNVKLLATMKELLQLKR